MINTIDFKNVTQLNWFNANGLTLEEVSKCIYAMISSCEKDKKRKTSILSKSGNNVVFVAGANLSRNANAETINQISKVYRQRNITILFLRGSLTPSEMFTPDSEANKAGDCAIMFVPDYTLVSIETVHRQKINTLFIGGQITPERSWKLKSGSLHSKRNSYYQDEAPLYDEDKFNELLSSDINIDAIFANYAPSFIEDPMAKSVHNWSKSDDKLIGDIESLSAWFDDVATKLRKVGKQPQMWIYPSAFDESNKSLPNTLYVSSDMKSGVSLLDMVNCVGGNKKESQSRGKYVTIINALEREDMGVGVGGRLAMGGHAGPLNIPRPLAAMNHPAIYDHEAVEEGIAEEDDFAMEAGQEIGEPDMGVSDSMETMLSMDDSTNMDAALPGDGLDQRVEIQRPAGVYTRIRTNNQNDPWGDYYTVTMNYTDHVRAVDNVTAGHSIFADGWGTAATTMTTTTEGIEGHP